MAKKKTVARKQSRKIEKRTSSDLQNPAAWLLDALGGGTTSASGRTISEKTILGLTAYFCGMRAISEDLAALPLKIYQRSNDGSKRELRQHPLWTLLHDRPNNECSAFSFRESMVANAILYGNSYAEIQRDLSGRPIALWLLLPEWVRLRRNLETHGLEYLVSTAGGAIVLQPENVLHLHGPSHDSVSGLRLAHILRDSIGAQVSAQIFNSKFFSNGAITSGIISHPGSLSDTAVTNLRDSFASRHAGDAAWSTVILEEGANYTPVSVDPQKSQMIESLNFGVEEAARALRINPNKLFSMVRAAGWSTLSAEQSAYWQETLHPWSVRLEMECNNRLVMPAEQAQIYCEHDFRGLLRGDAVTRADYNAKMFAIGATTINEIRAQENDPPIDGGDTHFVPSNLIPLDQAIEPPDVAADAPVQAPPGPTAPADQADNARALASLRHARADKIKRGTYDAAEHRKYATKLLQDETAVENYMKESA